MTSSKKRFTVYSTVSGGLPLNDISKVTASNDLNISTKDWLPMCASAYHISPSISDYIIIPVTIFPSDLPNRNCIGFSYNDLTEFDTDTGRLAYQSWIGKGLFSEHQNEDVTRSRGVILDSVMHKVAEDSPHWCVTLLTAWDRTKDPIIANSLLTNPNSCFSMGCYTADYECSYCHKLYSTGGCGHVDPHNPQMTLKDGTLIYLLAKGITGFELSHVKTPAFVDAITPRNQVVKLWD